MLIVDSKKPIRQKRGWKILYKFRYSKILYLLPLIFVLFLFILGNYVYSLYPKGIIAYIFLGIIVTLLFYSIRKFMRYPIIYDQNNKTFYVITSIFSEKYEHFSKSSIKETVITSRKIIIILKDKTIILPKYIKERDKLISILKGDKLEG